MISPAGFIVDTSFNGLPLAGRASAGLVPNIATGQSPNFTISPTPGPWIVTQLLPGGIVQLNGPGGQFELTGQLSGKQGSIQVDCAAGIAPSATQGLAFIVGNVQPTTEYIGIFLSGTNGPGFVATDVNGNVLYSESSGTYATGATLQLQLFWNSGTGTFEFYVNGVAQTVTYSGGSWTPFVPVAVVYGSQAITFDSLNPFVGRMNKVQVSNIGS
jgi:hypothetical protein